ncbi:MAG: sodium:proton antiporter [Bacteroidota bacterium]
MIQSSAPLFLVIPFLLLLGMIATGPVLYHHFWERYYPHIASGLAVGVISYYMFALGTPSPVVNALAEYIQFITLITALYMVSGGILIEVDRQATPLANLLFLWVGAIASNFIGTTGASVLLIRPYIRLNGKGVAAYHIAFFIFMVSNVGGVLTPIADPPLVLGFLKGVPFLWTLRHGILPWLLALSLLSIIFYAIDSRKNKQSHTKDTTRKKSIRVRGGRHFLLFLVIITAMFLDPNLLSWLPCLDYHGHRHSFLRELILLAVALVAYWTGEKQVYAKNDFSLDPLKEVIFIFIGIFTTMIPAIQLIADWAQSPAGQKIITPTMLYWSTGLFSSILDNAPTYLNFLAAGMGAKGLSIENYQDVLQYARDAACYLRATSLGAVFFGAMSYIGNGPNFMVRAIAEEQGIKMPSFWGYILGYSLIYLLPVLLLVERIFVAMLC